MRQRRSPRWAVFISGRGSNLQALLDLRDEIDIRVVVSSSPRAPGLGRARREGGVATLVLEKKIDWVALTKELRMRQVTHILLAGFMRIVPAEFLSEWSPRVVNLHPSLLPAYPGLKSIERAYADGAAMGVTLHQVVPEVDAGPTLIQRVQFHAGQAQDKGLTLEEAEFFIHVTEHKIVRGALRNWM